MEVLKGFVLGGFLGFVFARILFEIGSFFSVHFLFLFVVTLLGAFIGYLIVDGKREKEKLEKLSFEDSMTGLYNRFYLIGSEESTGQFLRKGRLFEEVVRSLRFLHPLSLLIVDIDHLKEINDSLGHSEGDELIKKVAAIIKSRVKYPSIAGRLSKGDEFYVLLEETDEKRALKVAHSILKEIRKLRVGGVEITASVGLCTLFPGRKLVQKLEKIEDRIELMTKEILLRADFALIKAKKQGKNRIFSSPVIS